ncbi:MAG: NAD(+)/NADH kinase [Bradymonadales bacterium]|jgi:NAD kinase
MIQSQFPENPSASTALAQMLRMVKRPFIPRYRRVALLHRAEHKMTVRDLEQVQQIHDDFRARGYELLRASVDDVMAEPPQCDLCVSAGGDGTVLRAAQWLRDTPICGVNIAPKNSVGFLCSVRMDEWTHFLSIFDAKGLSLRALQRMQCVVDGEKIEHVVLNECLFADSSPACASKYKLFYKGHEEVQSSSGVWVSTATGSSGALFSGGGERMPALDGRLQFRVREAFGLRRGEYRHLGGYIEEGLALKLEPLKDGMKLFFDGGIAEQAIARKSQIEFVVSAWPLWQLIFDENIRNA